jgi:hypothetical protein
MLSIEKSGFDDVIAKLKNASNIQSRIASVMEELCKIGAETIRTAYSDTTGSGASAASVKWERISDNLYEISAESEGLLYLEFGAGVSPRTGFTEYPNERPAGVVGIGQYGLGKGSQSSWSYMGKDGITHTTTGTRARCGFPLAVDAMIKAAPELLKGVF